MIAPAALTGTAAGNRDDCFRLPVLALLLLFSMNVAAQVTGKARIDGKWFSYPQRTGNARLDPSVSLLPAAIPNPPLKEEYLKPWREEQEKIRRANAEGRPIATHYTHCIPDGMPAMMMGMFPMEVLESPGQVTIIQEAYNQVRRIYLDQEQIPIEDAEPRFWGHSVGRWEGDTLVVDTIGIKEYVQFRNVPHSNQMRITERIRLVSDDIMEDEVTVEDPVYLTGPWTWKWLYERHPEYKMFEYVCEDNREYADPETGEAQMRLLSE
jgi:hypothetical protein